MIIPGLGAPSQEWLRPYTGAVRLRAGSRPVPTEARALLRRSADAVEAARRAARGETGAPSVGHGSGTLDVVMPGAVRRFRECHPGVALRLAELDAPTIEALVGTGDLDVGLVCPPVGDATSWQRGGEPRRRRSWPLG